MGWEGSEAGSESWWKRYYQWHRCSVCGNPLRSQLLPLQGSPKLPSLGSSQGALRCSQLYLPNIERPTVFVKSSFNSTSALVLHINRQSIPSSFLRPRTLRAPRPAMDLLSATARMKSTGTGRAGEWSWIACENGIRVGMCSCAHDGFRLLARHVSPGEYPRFNCELGFFWWWQNLDVEWEDWRIFTAGARTGGGPPVPHRHCLGCIDPSSLLPIGNIVTACISGAGSVVRCSLPFSSSLCPSCARHFMLGSGRFGLPYRLMEYV